MFEFWNLFLHDAETFGFTIFVIFVVAVLSGMVWSLKP